MDLRLPLTNPQRRALRKLKSEWQTRADIGELLVTLNALANRGLANWSVSSHENIWRITPLGAETLNALDVRKDKRK